ncbi:MAG TPA: TlpA disulfide reductase family protein [Chryseolinea sp.]
MTAKKNSGIKALITLCVGFCLMAGPATAQENPEEQAMFQAQRMAAFFNNRNFAKYTTFIAPGEYGSKETQKEKFITALKENVPGGAEIMNLERVAFKTFDTSQQILLLAKYQDQYRFIAGISEDGGERWLFTQPLYHATHFEIIQELIPLFDASFALLIDPGFRTRAHFTLGKPLPPFKFIDLKGDSVTLDQMKGKRIVLNFWLTGCKSCTDEIPQLNDLVKASDSNTAFIAPAFYASKESLETSLAAQTFLYTVVMPRNHDDYSVYYFPMHIVTDENHVVVLKLQGDDPNHLKKIKEALEKHVR